MSLSVAPLAGFPSGNSALLSPSNGSPVDAAYQTYSANATLQVEDPSQTFTYTPGGNVFVAGILDLPGVQPSRIFPCNNTGANTAAVSLPTLNQIILVEETGGSIQEFGSTSVSQTPGSFIILLNPATGVQDDGVYPLGYPGPVAWTLQGGAYTSANAATGYPQPIQKFTVSFAAMLIIASTQYG